MCKESNTEIVLALLNYRNTHVDNNKLSPNTLLFGINLEVWYKLALNYTIPSTLDYYNTNTNKTVKSPNRIEIK